MFYHLRPNLGKKEVEQIQEKIGQIGEGNCGEKGGGRVEKRSTWGKSPGDARGHRPNQSQPGWPHSPISELTRSGGGDDAPLFWARGGDEKVIETK